MLSRLRVPAAAAVAGSGALLYARRHQPNRRHDPLAELSTREAAVDALRTDGFCILSDWIPQQALGSVASTSAVRGMPHDATVENTREWRQSAFGRYHRIKFSTSDTAALEQLEAPLLPLIRAFFGSGDFYRSELQLLTAVPSSAHQMWHSDNRSRGLSLLVPLVDFTLENGATQLLPGSHRLAQAHEAIGHGPRVACARRGSVVAYDARTYHRGLGNETGTPRPAVVLRYDSPETPPPGVGVLGTMLHATAAGALHWLGGASASLRGRWGAE